MNASVLTQAQAKQHCWRILDTGFEPLRFLQRWQTWREDQEQPRILHYVALTRTAPTTQALLNLAPAASNTPLSSSHLPLHGLAHELAKQWRDLRPGFHRLSLAQGRVLLTLCIGELRPMLREQQFAADEIYLDARAHASWDRWDLKALTRCCRRGTELACEDAPPALQQDLTHSGFAMRASDSVVERGVHIQGVFSQWVFDPQWDIKTSRESLRYAAATPTTCAVIGAGLAGASVAAALARRGWQVEVFDAAAKPAAGASGLPAGLLVAHTSADDNPRSRLSRSGVRLTLQQAQELLSSGQDWEHSGVLERNIDGGLDHWHAQAGWIKPTRLVQQWLSAPGVQFCGSAQVTNLRRVDGQWELLNASHQCVGRAQHVVLANAMGVQALLDVLAHDATAPRAQLPTLAAVRGSVSWGARLPSQAQALPKHPVNGNGSLIPAVPVEGGTAYGSAWYCGATYEPATQTSSREDTAAQTAAHHANLDKLRTLLPEAAAALAKSHVSGEMHLWQGTRCVSSDRLPLVGALHSGPQPSLWISAAMGSRGLSFAVLCAELLAARIGAEPLPVEASLARFLEAGRGQTAL